MRYVKVLFLSVALLVLPLIHLKVTAQDQDDVTESEALMMDAAESGDLESIDETLDKALSDDTSDSAAGAEEESIDLGDESFNEEVPEEGLEETGDESLDDVTENVTEDAGSEAVDTELDDSEVADFEAVESDEELMDDASMEDVSEVADEEAVVADEEMTSEAVIEEDALEEASMDDSVDADALDVSESEEAIEEAPADEEKGVVGDDSELADDESGLTEEDLLADDASSEEIVEEASLDMPDVDLTEEESADLSVESEEGLTEEVSPVSEADEASIEDDMAVEDAATDVDPVATTEDSEPTGDLDSMIDEAMTTPVAPVEPEAVSRPAPARSSKKAFSNEELIQQEETRRRALEIHALETLAQADRAYSSRDYIKAGKLYEEAFKYLGTRTETRKEKSRAESLSGKANYRAALEYRKQNKLEEAEKAAQIALDRKYRAAAKLLAEIQKERNVDPDAKPAEPVEAKPKDVWKRDETKQSQKSIDELLKEGKQFLAMDNLDAAAERFEMILKQDPYNANAIRMLEKTAIKKYDRATTELNATRQNMMNDVRETWNPRDYAEGVVTAGGPGAEGGTVGGTAVDTEKRTEAQEIEDRMKKIIIPEIDFRQFNIYDAVKFFHEASRENGGTGINFILHLGKGAPPGMESAEEDVDFEMEESGGGEEAGYAADDVPLISFNVENISLFKALKTVMTVTELRYTIEDGVVMILRGDATTDKMVTRKYDVLPTLITRFSSEAGGGEEDLGGEEGWGGDAIADDAIATSERVELKPFFARMGVKWPEGSEISYIPTVSKLFVKNTEDNLVEFEAVLKQINIPPSQIEIEARFVEVNQTEANELGFEWILKDDWEIAEKTTTSGSLLGTAQYIQVEADDTGGFTKGLRFLEDLSLDAPADDIVTVASVLTNPELEFVIHALQQKGNADLLSAPKVTTQSGVAARISVVTEYVYPTEFTVTPITGTSENGTTVIVGGVVEPSSFNMREVGVVLDVTPEVTSDGKMISLVMAPKVVTEPTWKNYGSTYTAPDGSTQQLTMEQPFFHTRSVETQVLIYNGATVVMGGMINEARTEAEDKIPLLGDIPIIGRLFQSKYEASEKRNLLIFVTARLVDPSGKPLLTPNFNPLVEPDWAKATESDDE